MLKKYHRGPGGTSLPRAQGLRLAQSSPFILFHWVPASTKDTHVQQMWTGNPCESFSLGSHIFLRTHELGMVFVCFLFVCFLSNGMKAITTAKSAVELTAWSLTSLKATSATWWLQRRAAFLGGLISSLQFVLK